MTRDRRRSHEVAFAAFGLAVLITGDDERAIATLDAASRRTLDAGSGYLTAVRQEARTWRAMPADPEPVPLPAALAEVSLGDWVVLERVALRGMTASEAALALGIARSEALRRLQRALTTAGLRLDHGRQKR